MEINTDNSVDTIRISRNEPTSFFGKLFTQKRKTYQEVMSAFITVKQDLTAIVDNNASDIKDIEKEIEELEQEKAVVAEEKGKAEETLAFLEKMVK